MIRQYNTCTGMIHELVERLKLLIAWRAAGNTRNYSHLEPIKRSQHYQETSNTVYMN